MNTFLKIFFKVRIIFGCVFYKAFLSKMHINLIKTISHQISYTSKNTSLQNNTYGKQINNLSYFDFRILISKYNT